MHTNSAGVSTLHLAEGQKALDGVPDNVVLVGPGSGELVEEVKAEVKALKPRTAKKAIGS